jgi:hypothetical protein
MYSDCLNPNLFQDQEVVWAKIVGYPWWPAKVSFSLSFRLINQYEIRKINLNKPYKLFSSEIIHSIVPLR